MTDSRTIMIVDDEEIVKEFLEYALTEEGFEVLTADNGVEALEILGDDSLRCDIAIVDLSMPGMDGIELCRRIAEIRPAQKMMLSTGSYSSEEDIIEIKKRGICSVIRKPFNLAEVITLINNELGST